ncbi:hypothetical protein HYH02_000374 [Chlamydomonas schloesseri]|uniref:Uncharacterized protein n=1 Tax=Chlamydomonas schloesseri TaxID=2026947 RepID=A0A835WV09_9CHLO|nr:hypothetical protein HYH02_000374 [Chlamydomonas schloesseri]|eukprot:KAG2454527.1 hypothetical protein HYH02_000374 [Chlamydomonas schloesseri]
MARPVVTPKVDNMRVVERRSTELKRLAKQFSGVVARPSRFEDEAVRSWLEPGHVPTRQRWSARLERDVRAVCGEAGLTTAAAAAVVRAASTGVISQNPGVLLSRLLSFNDCLSEPLGGRRGVLSVLRKAPSLLRYSPESLRWNADMLAALLPEGAVGAVLGRAPMLLPCNAMTLWGNFEGLRTLLGLDAEATLKLVVRAPRLLHNTRGALEGRLEDLAVLAGLMPPPPPAAAAAAATTRFQPSAHGGGSAAVASSSSGGGGVGGMRRAQAAEAEAERAAARARVAAVVARQPSLLGYFPATLERNLHGLAQALGVSLGRVQPLLLKYPPVAMLAADGVAERLAGLRAAARGALDDPADLAAVLLRQPSLLAINSEVLLRKVLVIERLLRLEGQQDALRAVLRGAPQLMTLSSQRLESKALALAEAVAPSRGLSAQLARATPLRRALWLCFSEARYRNVRLAAEAEAHLEAQEAQQQEQEQADMAPEVGSVESHQEPTAAPHQGRARAAGLHAAATGSGPQEQQLAAAGSAEVVEISGPAKRRRGRGKAATTSAAAAAEPDAESATRTAGEQALHVLAHRRRPQLYKLLQEGCSTDASSAEDAADEGEAQVEVELVEGVEEQRRGGRGKTMARRGPGRPARAKA